MRRAWLTSLVLFVAACQAGLAGSGSQREADEATPRFLVLHKAASSLGFYTLEGDLIEAVAVGRHPHEMVLSSDGRYAYVTDYGAMSVEAPGEGANTVSIIDIQDRKKVGDISLGAFHRPHGIDLDRRSGRIAVTTENPNRLLLLDPASRKVLRDFDTKGRTSHMVLLAPDGKRAFVSNVASRNVSVIDLETGNVELIAAKERPEGSVLSKDGETLYVANRESGSITVINTASNTVLGEIPTGKGPARVRLTADEKLLVYALLQEKRVGFADIASREQVATVDLDGAPVSLQMSGDGAWALAAAQNEDTVYIISVSERKILRSFKTPAGSGPDPVVDIGGLKGLPPKPSAH